MTALLIDFSTYHPLFNLLTPGGLKRHLSERCPDRKSFTWPAVYLGFNLLTKVSISVRQGPSVFSLVKTVECATGVNTESILFSDKNFLLCVGTGHTAYLHIAGILLQ